MATRLPPQRPDWRTTKKRLLSRHKRGKASAMELFNFDQTGRKPGCKTLVCTASRQTEDLSMAMPTKRRVLVVDDDPGVRDSMAMSLQSAGYKVAAAEDGLSALSLLRASAPDAIVSDLNMPRMSGFELLSLVRCFFPGIVSV